MTKRQKSIERILTILIAIPALIGWWVFLVLILCPAVGLTWQGSVVFGTMFAFLALIAVIRS